MEIHIQDGGYHGQRRGDLLWCDKTAETHVAKRNLLLLTSREDRRDAGVEYLVSLQDLWPSRPRGRSILLPLVLLRPPLIRPGEGDSTGSGRSGEAIRSCVRYGMMTWAARTGRCESRVRGWALARWEPPQSRWPMTGCRRRPRAPLRPHSTPPLFWTAERAG